MGWADYGISGHITPNTPIKENHKLALIAALEEKVNVILTSRTLNFSSQSEYHKNSKILNNNFISWIYSCIDEMIAWFPDSYGFPGELWYVGNLTPPSKGYSPKIYLAEWFNAIYDLLNEMQNISVRNVKGEPPYIYSAGLFDPPNHNEYYTLFKNINISYDVYFDYYINYVYVGYKKVAVPGTTTLLIVDTGENTDIGAEAAYVDPHFDFHA